MIWIDTNDKFYKMSFWLWVGVGIVILLGYNFWWGFAVFILAYVYWEISFLKTAQLKSTVNK